MTPAPDRLAGLVVPAPGPGAARRGEGAALAGRARAQVEPDGSEGLDEPDRPDRPDGDDPDAPGELDGGLGHGERLGSDEDLVAGARRRTEVALAAVARAASLPSTRPGPRVRWRIGPRAALAAVGVLAALGAGAAWWWWPSGDPVRLVSLAQPAAGAPVPTGAVPAGADPASAVPAGAVPTAARGTAPADGASDRGAADTVVVHVVGAVASAGVVRLAAGARVADAVEAAGGARPDADLAGVNLARLLSDGEQVVVPVAGAAGAAGAGAGAGPGAAGGSAGSAGGVLDLNTADAEALDGLPGIGPVLARRIVAWRAEHGRFTSVDELGEVTGIGPTLLAGVRDLVRV